jgi:hypothetical protein
MGAIGLRDESIAPMGRSYSPGNLATGTQGWRSNS